MAPAAELPRLERPTTVRWGHPLGAKPLGVLFVLPRIAQRDAMELAVRLDMDYEAVFLDPPPADSAAGDRFEGLRKCLERRRDLIILANVDVASLPEAVFARIEEMVRGGAGLLLANHRRNVPDWFNDFLQELAPVESASPITRGIAEGLTPEWRGGLDFVQASTYGSGRVVQLNYPGTGPFYHALLPELIYPEQADWTHYETYWSLVAKAALWAAQREPSQWIDRILEAAVREAGFEELPPGMTEEEMREYAASTDTRMLHAYQLHLNAPAKETYGIVAQLRQPGRQWRTQFLQPEESLEAGEESFPLAVPAIPGAFYLDTWLKDGDKTVDWHSIAATISVRPFFDRLRPEQDVVQANDTILVTLELLPSQRTEDGLRRCVVALRATDPYGRRVGFGTQEAPGKRRTFTARLDVADLISNRLALECLVFSQSPKSPRPDEIQLVNAGGARIPLGVRLAGPAQGFVLAIANHTSQEYGLRAFNELLAKAGVTAIVVPAREDAARFVPETGQTPIFQLTEYWTPQGIDAIASEGNVPQGAPPPPALEKVTQEVRRLRLGAAEGFLLGGANGLSETYDAVRTSPSVMQEFRAALWSEFGEPSALGGQWASRFQAWDGLTLETIQQAADEGFFEPWMRFCQHVDAVFLRLYGMGRDAVHAAESEASAGFSMAASREGISPLWRETAAAIEFVAAPPDPGVMARAAAYRAPDARTVLLVPGAATPEQGRWWPWHAALHRHSGLWWNLDEGPESVLDAGGAVDPVFSEVIAQTRAVRAGFSELFLMAYPAETPIAVYDSRPSELLHGATGQSGAFAGALVLLRSLGLAAALVPSDDVRAEVLATYKCLVLPGVDVLSDAETAGLRMFVESGGMLLADTPPGAFDVSGRPREKPPLDDMFTPLPAPGSEAAPDAAAGAQPPPQKSAQAYILNQSFSEDFPEETRTRLQDALRLAGAAEIFEISGKRPFDGQRFCFRFGKARVYAALVQPACARRSKFRLGIPDEGYVYDMQKGLEVRRPRNMGWRADPAGVALFSVLPYRVTDVQVAVPKSVPPGHRVTVGLRILTADQPPGDHLVHVQLRPLGGTPLSYYDKTVLCVEGEGETYIPLALNEAPGLYKVIVRDVLTGMVSEWPVEVSGGHPGAITVSVKSKS